MFYYILKFNKNEKGEDIYDLLSYAPGGEKPKITKDVVYNYYFPDGKQTNQIVVYSFKREENQNRKLLFLIPTANTIVDFTTLKTK